MAHQSLYRRYRSRNFAEILGQEHVTNALRNAVAEGRNGHAYLFSGPRGTGKTSTARVLAKALNCPNLEGGEPCTTCDSCVAIERGNSFDLHELDAASNNKVDDVRDLIAKVALGSPGRTKVYVLDEVHMLTAGAENALLKTLEEPPEHVVFVLATTEPHKVVETIRSRTQHYQFTLLSTAVLEQHVRDVIADADLDVDDAGIEYVLRQGGGSARDTLSALDLVAAAGGPPSSSEATRELVLAVGAGDPAAAIAAVQRGITTGREPRTIGEEVLRLLRHAFLAAMGATLDQLSERASAEAGEIAEALGPATITRSLETIGAALVEMRQAADPRVPLEVAILRLARRGGDDVAALLQRIEALEAQVAELSARPAADVPQAAPAAPPAATEPTAPASRQRTAGEMNPSAGAAQPSRNDPAPAGTEPNDSRPPTDAASPADTAQADDRAQRLDNRSPNETTTPTDTASPGPSGRTTRPSPGPAGNERGRQAPPAPTPRRPAPPPPSDRRQPAAVPDATRPSAAPADAAPSADAPPPADTAPPPAAPADSPPHAGMPPTPTPAEPVAGHAGLPHADPSPTSARGADPSSAPSTPQAADVEPPTSSDPAPAASPPSAPPATAGSLSLGALTQAFDGDLLDDPVPQKVRTRFRSGRFVALADGVATFAVPNAHYQPRVDEVRADVEAAIERRFGEHVTIQVVVDSNGAPSDDRRATPAPAAAAPSAPEPAPDDDPGAYDVSELTDADDVAASGVDRLTQAFPGAQVVPPPNTQEYS